MWGRGRKKRGKGRGEEGGREGRKEGGRRREESREGGKMEEREREEESEKGGGSEPSLQTTPVTTIPLTDMATLRIGAG